MLEVAEFGAGEFRAGELGVGELRVGVVRRGQFGSSRVKTGWFGAGWGSVEAAGAGAGGGLRGHPLVLLELALGVGGLVAEMLLGPELAERVLVLTLLGEQPCGVLLGRAGGGAIAVQRGFAGSGVVGFDVVGAVQDASTFLGCPGLAVEDGRAACKVGGVALRGVFVDPELLHPLLQCGAPGAGEPPEPVEVVFGAGALFGGVAGSFTRVSPLGVELVGFPYDCGKLIELRAFVIDRLHVAATLGVGGDLQLLGLLVGRSLFLCQAVSDLLVSLHPLNQVSFGEMAVGPQAPVRRDRVRPTGTDIEPSRVA